ncbi:MAG: CatB-related O-acetyltransferase [Planctomycetota bacterium]|nr:CatB-related O-acetyltransferase [Planctomycetota bacterium]
MSAILRAEGEMFSQTARDLMTEFHGVSIGAYSYGPCFIPNHFPPQVTIGRYVSLGPETRVYNSNHPTTWLSTHPFFYDPRAGLVDSDLSIRHALEIGHDCWLGARATVTPGCRKIGIGAIVGAGSVVTKNVPDFAIVGGVPAKLIRYRFCEATRKEILASCWWELSIDQIRKDAMDMVKPLAELSHHALIGDLP